MLNFIRFFGSGDVSKPIDVSDGMKICLKLMGENGLKAGERQEVVYGRIWSGRDIYM